MTSTFATEDLEVLRNRTFDEIVVGDRATIQRTGLPKDPVYRILWTENLEEVDREIVRLAVLCQVKLLEPGVIRRVLQKDASVCGAPNAKGFAKLHDLILLHLAMREKSLDSFGPAQTAAMENYVVERLRTSFPDVPGGWPSA